MKRFDVTWVEYHSATVMAEDDEEAQEIATSLDSNHTYSDSDEMTVTIVTDEKCYPLTEMGIELGETFPEAYAAWIQENS